MNVRRLLHRTAFVVGLACVARGAPHDFTTGHGTSPGAPGNPNRGQPPCHHGSANDPDARGDSDPVDLFRGELILDRRDLFVPGRGLAVDLTFHYRSQSVERGQFGYGWTCNYSRRIRKLDDGDAALLQGTNYLQVYDAQGGGVYASPPGIYSTLHGNVDGTFTLTYRHGTVEQYDVNGCLTRVEDLSGNAVTFAYDPAGLRPIVGPSNYLVGRTKAVLAREYRLTQITDTVGNTYDFEYNADGLLAAIEYLGRTITYAYSAAGDLESVTLPATTQFPAGRTTTYTYVNHNLTQVHNAKGELTLTTVYDAATDRVTSQTFDGGTSTYAITTAAGTTKAIVVDRKGFTTEYTFNAEGQVVQSKRFTDGLPAGEPASYVTAYQYATSGELVRVVPPRGNAIELSRDAFGNVTEVRQKKIGATPWTPSVDDIVEAYTYEPVYRRLKTITDALGRTTTLTYDYELSEPSRGLLRQVTLPAPPSGPAPEIEYTYDVDGLLVQVDDPNGNSTRLDRDVATGFVEKVTRGFGTAAATAVELEYDDFGNVTAVRNGLGEETTLEYDAHDLVTKVVSPAPQSFEMHCRYDANDKLVQLDQENGGGALPALGTADPGDGWLTSRLAYNDFSRITSFTDDEDQATTFEYDANGNLETVVDALGRSTSFTYDERDLPLTAVDSQTPAGTTEYRFDANGNLSSIRSPESHLTSRSYDDFDRLKRTTFPDASYEELGYDAASNVTSLRTPNGQTITLTFDEQDRMKTVVRASGTDTYEYDAGGRMIEASNAEAEVVFQYDAADRATHETTTFAGAASGHSVVSRYDAAARVDRITYPGGVNVFRGYDELGRLETISAATLLATYGYDPLGNLTSLVRANGVETTHEFDALGRLTELDQDGPLGSLDARTFGYDALDRRTSEVGPEGTHAFEYDELSQLVETTRPGGYAFPGTTFVLDENGNRTSAGGTTYVPNSLDQYQSVGGTPYTYDLAGNLTSDGVRTFGYDEESRLTSASGTLLTATYGYDALGRRIRKTVNGTKTLYVHDGEQILQELNAAEVVQAVYRYGAGLDQPLTMRRNNVPSWYLTDPIGTVTAITDATGNVVESYRYDAFGEVAIFDGAGAPLSASAVGNSFLFTGRELDPETELYHYRARAYSPQLGRFLQRDPLGQAPDVNVFRYVGNHPLDATDAFGLFQDDFFTLPNFVNASAGFGDTLWSGLTFLPDLGLQASNFLFDTPVVDLSMGAVRRAMGIDDVVDKCSRAYTVGEVAGTVAAVATGGIGGIKGAGAKVGKNEFSHFIPDSFLKRLGPWAQRLGDTKLNGNYVTPWRAYLQEKTAGKAMGRLRDRFRARGYGKAAATRMAEEVLGKKWSWPRAMFDRLPRLPLGVAFAAGAGLGTKFAHDW